jgi:hypothetical protein
MFRKILIATVAALSTLSPLALPAPTQAHEPYGHHHRHHEYHVYYRACCSEPWCSTGCFGRYEDAYRVACSYQHRGFEAVVCVSA